MYVWFLNFAATDAQEQGSIAPGGTRTVTVPNCEFWRVFAIYHNSREQQLRNTSPAGWELSAGGVLGFADAPLYNWWVL
jgi:hypothetical protein